MAPSHVGTTEWQSFEARMRRRRAERCLLRADGAIEARRLDEARERLEEARRLWPSAPELDALDKRLAAATVPPHPAEAERGAVVLEMPARLVREPAASTVIHTPAAAVPAPTPHHRYARSAAALLILLLIVLGSAFWYGATRDLLRLGGRATQPSEARASVPFAPADPVQPGPGQREPAVVVSSTTEVVVNPVRERPAADTADAPAAALSRPATADTASTAAPRPAERAADPVAAAPRLDSEASAPVPANLPAPERATATTPTAPRVEPIAALAAPPPAEPAPAPVSLPPAVPASSTPPVVNEVDRVRAVLDRYESAYTSLDAHAAGAVYPRLDTRALARAFDGLSAQRVSLGRCDVVVNTMTAQANCAGSASWTPKVGGAAQTSARQWRFELRRNGDTWQIAEAVMR